MAQSLCKEYAARSQTSDIFGAQQQDNQKPGRRVVQGQAENNIFSENDGEDASGQRNQREPAPFLTESNAVNTHGRRGGYVEKTDSLMDTESAPNGRKVHYEGEYPEMLEDDDSLADNGDRLDKFNENSNTAKTHKARNMTSHIFDANTPESEGKRSYNRDHMSNVF